MDFLINFDTKKMGMFKFCVDPSHFRWKAQTINQTRHHPENLSLEPLKQINKSISNAFKSFLKGLQINSRRVTMYIKDETKTWNQTQSEWSIKLVVHI